MAHSTLQQVTNRLMFEVKTVLKIQQAVRICLLDSAELVTSIVVTLVGLSCEEY
jgi:hypothetical protein